MSTQISHKRLLARQLQELYSVTNGAFGIEEMQLLLQEAFPGECSYDFGMDFWDGNLSEEECAKVSPVLFHTLLALRCWFERDGEGGRKLPVAHLIRHYATNKAKFLEEASFSPVKSETAPKNLSRPPATVIPISEEGFKDGYSLPAHSVPAQKPGPVMIDNRHVTPEELMSKREKPQGVTIDDVMSRESSRHEAGNFKLTAMDRSGIKERGVPVVGRPIPDKENQENWLEVAGKLPRARANT